jgi:Raf kinase inhibitor-like YbhB/YbcL family protein
LKSNFEHGTRIQDKSLNSLGFAKPLTFYWLLEGKAMKLFFIISIQILSLCLFSTTYSKEGVKEDMVLTSTNFTNQGAIPGKHTCEGNDVSPALTWANAPAGTKSFALIVDDPDAPDPANPKMTWVHWVLYNIPASTATLPEGVKGLPDGTLEGLNDWKQTGYRGPCPPIGRHRYFCKLYALDIILADLKTPAKAKLEKAMEGHVLAKTELVGTYQKK